MKHYLDTSDAPYAIMMEDDCDLDVVRFWNFNWIDVFSYFPYDWDVIQLAIICTGDLHVKLHKRFVNDFSTACYVIARHHAEKLVRLHCRGGYTGEQKYKLDQGVKPRPVADDLIYNSGNTFSIPLLMYKIELGSSIHPDHIGLVHNASHKALWQYWQQMGSTVNISDHMNYDPYLGRITEASPPPEEPETYPEDK